MNSNEAPTAEPTPPTVTNDGSATSGDDAHETGGGHDDMGPGSSGS